MPIPCSGTATRVHALGADLRDDAALRLLDQHGVEPIGAADEERARPHGVHDARRDLVARRDARARRDQARAMFSSGSANTTTPHPSTACPICRFVEPGPLRDDSARQQRCTG